LADVTAGIVRVNGYHIATAAILEMVKCSLRFAAKYCKDPRAA